MNRKYFALTKANNSAEINIYGDITSFPWFDGDMSANNLSKQLDGLDDVQEINVHINSYGGEVAEGLAIYNALKRHPAKIKTFCDGFACSIASVIFMAGDERIMNDSSLLMIHNAWSFAEGNATELRKLADDLEKITQASIVAYKAHSNLSEDEIKELLDAESWILPEEALNYGFATAIEKTESAHASQSAKRRLLDIVKQHKTKGAEGDEGEPEEPEQPETADGENGEPEEPDTEEPPTDSPKDNPEGEEPKEKDSETVQKMSGFFNALLKM